MPNRFRIAWVVDFRDDKDYNTLYDMADEVRYLSAGHNSDEEHELLDLVGNLQTRLQQFDPKLDILVPSGRTAVGMLACFLVGSRHDSMYLAVYSGLKVAQDGRKVPSYRVYHCVKASGGATMLLSEVGHEQEVVM